MKNVKCLKCIRCGKEYEALPDATTCECGGILDVVYDYDYIRENFSPESISSKDSAVSGETRDSISCVTASEASPRSCVRPSANVSASPTIWCSKFL